MTPVFLKLSQYIALVIVIALAAQFVLFFLFRQLKKHHWIQTHFWSLIILDAIEIPIQVFIWLNATVYVMDMTGDAFGWWGWSHQFSKWQYLILLFSISWTLLNLKKEIEAALKDRMHFQEKSSLEKATADAFGRLASVAILLVSALMGLQIVGIPITSLLTISAVGAAGIAWASTDVVKNFFGGLMIHMTRPFASGDWINSPEKDIEGVVEEIGWYQTRIRTFDKQPLYVPNGIFPSLLLRNPSRMSHRKIATDIKLGYENLKAIPSILDGINQLLREHPAIDSRERSVAHCHSLSPYWIEINVQCFTRTTDWVQWRLIQQEVLLGIADILEKRAMNPAL